MNLTHITLRLPDDLAKALARWARLRNLPKSQVVREAVAQYLSGATATRLESRVVTAQDLVVRWPTLPRLTPGEATSLYADIEAARATVPQPTAPWE